MSDDVLIELTVRVDRAVHATDSQFVEAAERAEAVARQAVNGLVGCRVQATHGANLPASKPRPLRIKDQPRWMWDDDAIDDTVGEDDPEPLVPFKLAPACEVCGLPTLNGLCHRCGVRPSWLLDPEAEW